MIVLLLPAALVSVLAAVLVLAGAAGGWAVVAAAGFCVLLIALGWGELLRLPHPRGTTLLIGGLGVANLVAGEIAVRPESTVDSPLPLFAAVLAGAVLLSFAHELLRRDGRPDIVESLTGTVAGQIVAVLAVGWVLQINAPHGLAGAVIGAAAITGCRFATILPLPASIQPWAGVGAGALAALVASFFVAGVDPAAALAAGLAAAAVGVALDRLFPSQPNRFALSTLARVATGVAAAGTVTYAVLNLGLG